MISWHRFYVPETGRYITADPIGLAGGINLYAYVAGDPINKIDPWGLMSLCDAISYLIPLPWWGGPVTDALCGGSPTSSNYGQLCILTSSEPPEGGQKACFYDCMDGPINSYKVLLISECDECPNFAMFDINNPGTPPLWVGN